MRFSPLVSRNTEKLLLYFTFSGAYVTMPINPKICVPNFNGFSRNHQSYRNRLHRRVFTKKGAPQWNRNVQFLNKHARDVYKLCQKMLPVRVSPHSEAYVILWSLC